MRRLELQLEGATQALVGALVLSVALVASHIQPWNVPGARGIRWLTLAELGDAALAMLALRRRAIVPVGLEFEPLLTAQLKTVHPDAQSASGPQSCA